MPLKFHYNTLIVLKGALKANRQLTFAEQVQANETLDVLRRAALREYRMGAPDKTVIKENLAKKIEADPPRVARLKRAGLLEAARYLDNCSHDEIDSETAELLTRLIEEASNDYKSSPDHKIAKPTAVARIDLKRAAQSAADAAARLADCENRLEAQAQAMASIANESVEIKSAFDALKARIERLESAATEHAQNFVNDSQGQDEKIDALDKRVGALESVATEPKPG